MTLMMCFVGTSFGQIDSIRVTPLGLTETVIKTNHSVNTIYNKTIGWVNETYKNPEKVLVGNVEGQSVTVSGYSSNAWHYRAIGTEFFYDISYHIYITISDSLIGFKILIDEMYVDGQKYLGSTKDFFKKSGEYKELYNTAKSSLEGTLNNLLFSYYNKINSQMTSAEAIEELRKSKDKLDLGLITQEEYEKKKQELSIFIK